MRSVMTVVSALLLLITPISAAAAVYENGPPAGSSQGGQEPIVVPDENLIYASNPNFDWTSVTYDINWGNGLQTVLSPFHSPLDGLENLDYDPDDGWVLMAMHFGDAGLVATPAPFLILYNKYRGLVRFIIYLHDTNENYPYGRITLRFSSGSSQTKNLRNKDVLYPLSRHPYNNQVAIINIQQGWNYADFIVGYDPGTDQVLEPLFAFDIDGVDENTVTLEGDATSTAVTMGVTNMNQSPLFTLDNMVAGVNKAKKAYNNVNKIAADIDSFLTRFEDEDHQNFWADLSAQIAMGSPAMSAIAGAVGFAQHFLGLKKKDNQPTVTKTQTHLTLSGSITAVDDVVEVLLRVPGANHNGKPNALPIYDEPLGVIAVNSDPGATYYTSNSDYRDIVINDPWCCYSGLSWMNYMDVLSLNGAISYEVNPAAGLEVRSLEAAWSFSVPHPKSEGSMPGGVTWWNETPPYYIDWVNDLVDAGRWVIVGSADPHDVNFYEYRTQYVDIDEFHNYKPEVSRLFLYTQPWYGLGQGVTAPVLVKGQFKIPGRPETDDVFIVESYDLWWPPDSPWSNENPPGLDPVWVEPQFSDGGIPGVTNGDNRGSAWVDYNDNGTLDLATTSPFGDGFLVNDGSTFTPSSILNGQSSIVAVWGDYDDDGDEDVYLVRSGANTLLRNNNGTFVDVTATTGLGDTGSGEAAAWGDFDNDGDLDLFVGNWGGGNVLYRNTGSVFTVVSGIQNTPMNTACVTWVNYDNDSDLDLYVAGHGGNKLFRNNSGASFSDVTSSPIDDPGTTGGCAWGDYDNDGDMDLVLARDASPNKLFRNEGSGAFVEDVQEELNVALNSADVDWGDYDNDGDLDLLFANWGAVDKLYENVDGMFMEAPEFPVLLNHLTTGSSFGDYDGDGALDIYLAGSATSELIKNSPRGNWLEIKLNGRDANEAGVGAKITVSAGGQIHTREMNTGSDNGQNPLIAHFGLGNNASVDWIKVKWYKGQNLQTVYTSNMNQVMTINQPAPPPPPPGGCRDCEFTQADADVDALRLTTAFGGVYPNPTPAGAKIAFSLDREDYVRLEVFTATGRKVASIANRSFEPGRYALEWDGKDGAGALVAQGVYFVKMMTRETGLSQTAKLLITR